MKQYLFLLLFLCLIFYDKASLAGKDDGFQASNKLKDDRKSSSQKIVDSYLRDKKDDNKLIIPKVPPSIEPVKLPKEVLESKKLVTINVSQDVPVKDVIIEVANLAEVDVEVDPQIDSYVILSLENRPVADVFQRIAELASLRYSVKGGVVRFERDLPYLVNYNLSFLDLTKTNQGQNGFRDVGGDAVNSFNNRGGNSANGQSNSQSSSQSGQQTSSNAVTDSATPQGGMPEIESSRPNEWSLWRSLTDGLRSVVKGEDSYTINRQAGVITVFGTEKTHKQVQKYIDNVKKYATSQVLIEVKLIEVELRDEFQSGIDFSALKQNGYDIQSDFTNGIGTLSTGSFVNPLVISTSKGTANKLTAAVNLLESFGTVKTISSPRLNVVNNQHATLSFAQNYVYFQVSPQLQNQLVTNAAVVTPQQPIIVNTTAKTVPVGIILALQASIDPDKDEITMSVHPSLSRIVSFKDDPAGAFLVNYIKSGNSNITNDLLKQMTNQIPIVEKKELDSVLKIRSGDIMVIGGFTEEKKENQENGVPFIKNIPFIGGLFKSKKEVTHSVETVIFIKATIIPSETGIINKDLSMYNNFAE
jgi:general secretion pathway protein D